jgi:starvation-inducible DNA-binding protein
MAMTQTSLPTIDTGLSEEDRARITDGLAHLLADTATLYFKTHGYHWNVTGPLFPSLHSLFEDQYRELYGSIDVIAERIRALGHRAPGSYRELATLTSVPEAEGTPGATEMVEDLALGHEQVARTARELLPVADGANDQPTVDLLSSRVASHEKAAWMLRSMLA